MLVGVIADSHDNLPKLRAAVELLRRCGAEHILHAGDFVAPFAVKVLVDAGIPFTGVFGNNDGERTGIARMTPNIHEPPYAFELGGRRIVLTHELERVSEAARARADVVVFGHTHEAEVEGQSLLLLNPGEVCGWLTEKCTVAVLDLGALEATVLEV